LGAKIKGLFQSLLGERILPLAAEIVKGDFNADGRMDWIIVPYGKTNELLLCLNSGNSRWTESAISLPEKAYFGGALVCDVDNDALTDVLLIGVDPDTLLFLRNIGGGFAAGKSGCPKPAFGAPPLATSIMTALRTCC
jgi:hypothetical protein